MGTNKISPFLIVGGGLAADAQAQAGRSISPLSRSDWPPLLKIPPLKDKDDCIRRNNAFKFHMRIHDMLWLHIIALARPMRLKKKQSARVKFNSWGAQTCSKSSVLPAVTPAVSSRKGELSHWRMRVESTCLCGHDSVVPFVIFFKNFSLKRSFSAKLGPAGMNGRGLNVLYYKLSDSVLQLHSASLSPQSATKGKEKKKSQNPKKVKQGQTL